MHEVCFINPPSPTDGAYLPTGLIRLTGIANQAGLKTTFIDLEQWRFSGRISFSVNFKDDLRRELRHIKASVYAITIMNVTWPWAATIIRLLKEEHPNSVVIAGGPQVTLHQRAIIECTSELDIACSGEWEKSIVNLLKSIMSTGDLTEIPGLTLRRQGRIVSTGCHTLEDNLEKTPFFSHTLESYYGNIEVLNIDAGRGCAYGCRFCSVAAISGRRPRFKSPETLISETCSYLDNHDNNSEILVSYEHDNFLGDPEFLSRFTSLKRKKGLSFSYACSSRLDLLTEAAIALLSQSRCRIVFIGIESGSTAVQRRCGKSLPIDRVEPVVRSLASYGIIAACNFIIGLPHETLDELHSSIELMGSISGCGGYVGCSIFCPEPGSYFGQVIPQEHWIPLKNTKWYKMMAQSGIPPEKQDKKLHAFLYTIPNQHYDIELITNKTFGFTYLLNHFPRTLKQLKQRLHMTWTMLWEELDYLGVYPGNELADEYLVYSYWVQQMRQLQDQSADTDHDGNYDEFIDTFQKEWTASTENRRGTSIFFNVSIA
jgi:radical SAM superfamily enzyme YgiQ (UPF0313 family)